MNNKDLIKQYVSHGLTLPEYQFDKLNNNLLGTYFKYRLLDGTAPIFPYEFNRMSDDLRKVYILKCLRKDRTFPSRYLPYLSDELKLFYFDNKIGNGAYISDDEFYTMPTSMKQKHLNNLIDSGKSVSEDLYEYMSDELKEKYILSNKRVNLSPYQLKHTNDRLALIYLNQSKNNGYHLKGYEADRLRQLTNGQ